jgi:hypothetical protein
MNARLGARMLALSRIALGAAILAAPETVVKRWMGEHARKPIVRYLSRMLAARDLALGLLALATVDVPGTGARVQAACAMADTVDALATLAVREELPPAGVIGTIAAAGTAAAAGAYYSRALPADR